MHYVVTSSTATTFAASVTFVNLTGTTLNNWNLYWSFPGNQTITSMTGAAFTQNKTVVGVKDAKNGSKLANGVSTTVTFNAKYSGINALPTVYTLGGYTCVIN